MKAPEFADGLSPAREHPFLRAMAGHYAIVVATWWLDRIDQSRR